MLRISLASYQILGWVKDELYHFLKSVATVTTVVTFPLPVDTAIDVHKLKSFLVR